VIGGDRDVPRALEHPAMGAQWFEVRGVVAVDDADDADSVRRHADTLHRLIDEHHADVVMVAGPLGPQMMRAASDLAQLHRCRLLAVMPTEVVPGHDPLVVWEGDAPLVQLAAHQRNRAGVALKRALDIVVSCALLAALSPLFILIGLAIIIESRGPVVFRHKRVGRLGGTFNCLKFRTMVSYAEEMLRSDAVLRAEYIANGFRIPDDRDPRVTRLGRILRRTSVDELPQLFNVLVGEMSLVGPRPVVPDELTHFAGSERLLLSMRPGITGQWAVSGRHRVAYPERAGLELDYVRRWSLKRDADILIGTVRAVAEYGGNSSRA
jgi:exopolysaccharide production protein ExoY